jgi:hypothetical protein
MLNGEETFVVKSNLEMQAFHTVVEDAMQAVGSTTVDGSGRVSISASRFANAFVDASFEGTVRKRQDGYTVSISYRVGFPILAWLIVICFGVTLVGFAALVPGFMAKSDIAIRLQRAAGEIRDGAA